MRVLIDVANGRITEELLATLARAGHTVERGAALVSARRFDVVVVGAVDAAVRVRREHPGVAVVVFTRTGDVEARIEALAAGADDAIDAGFHLAQSAMRIGAAGHRAAMVPRPPERIEIDGCTIDLSACTWSRDGVAQPLTRREVELVRWLSRHAERVVTRRELLEHVWRVSPGNETRAVDVAVAGLRAKIERDPAAPAIIVSVKGAGYRWG
ncbi:MAG TPA: winged helix-turn-helix domain-containing protein [Kofleriaceae bacterium]|nr:winged helix-turn-helix domain-containing protein [Kofleriaceae bacterium]